MLAMTASDAADYLLAFFLLVTGLALGWALFKLADVFTRTASFIRSSEREVMPVIHSAGGTVDRVNSQLDQIDPATASAVDVVEAVDEAVRAVSFAVKRPIEKLVGLSAGASHGFATLRTRRSFSEAMKSAKEAAARREADFEAELHKAHPQAVQPAPPRPSTPPPPLPPRPAPPSTTAPASTAPASTPASTTAPPSTPASPSTTASTDLPWPPSPPSSPNPPPPRQTPPDDPPPAARAGQG